MYVPADHGARKQLASRSVTCRRGIGNRRTTGGAFSVAKVALSTIGADTSRSVFGFKLKARKKDLAAWLREDVLQAPGWEDWLGAAASIDELHASCTQSGWLVYCAYFDGVSSDKLFAAAIEIGALAADRDPDAPVRSKTVRALDDLDGPALEGIVLDLERRYPLARQLVRMLPAQVNWWMMQLFDARRADDDAALPNLDPYRTDPHSDQARGVADAVVAAGYVCLVEAVYHKLKRLRESLAISTAASASALRGSYVGFDIDALAIQRRTFWR